MILVPRPAPHLPRTLEALQQAGHTNLFTLALSHPESLPVTLPAGTTALIFTSPLAPHKNFPGLPAYCVGDATAHAARSQGLHVIYPGTHNGAALADDIIHFNLPPQHFAHLHGDHAHIQWHAALRQAGHTVTPVLAYQTRRIETLPVEALPRLAGVTHTMLFSAGSASHLANLYKQVNIQPNGTAVALSTAVADAARAYWPEVVIAASPTLSAMVATIRNLNG